MHAAARGVNARWNAHRCGGSGEFRGARASRVLVSASRGDELPSRVVPEFVREFSTDAPGKFAKAGRPFGCAQGTRFANARDERATRRPLPALSPGNVARGTCVVSRVVPRGGTADGSSASGGVPGSALVPSAGEGVPPSRTSFTRRFGDRSRVQFRHGWEVRFGGTPKPARETRALPGNLCPRSLADRLLGVTCPLSPAFRAGRGFRRPSRSANPGRRRGCGRGGRRRWLGGLG